ncbi:MAG TPA: lipoprotein signal peptidase [Saprospiraceae bacterium]|nr:lipoprotein signal peptidase [Saprospiraceae bacterium]
MNPNKYRLAAIITIFLVLFIDQSSKIWVKLNMEMGEEILIFGQSWAKIKFIENEGMAFGLSLGGTWGKIALSVFRVVAVGFLFYILKSLIQSKERIGVIIAFSMILAGALGNIIDSAIYGIVFSDSHYHGGIASLFPEGGGYAPFLMGKVVDMLYFPMAHGHFPSWSPIWPGEEFEFFNSIFNVADSSIFCGICIFLIFYRDFFNHPKVESQELTQDKLETPADKIPE